MLTLKKDFFDQIVKHSLKELPNEACGLLAGPLSPRISRDTYSDACRADEAGWVKAVERVYEMTNIDKSPESFLMDPKEQLKITKEIRNSGLDMIGIYHSHLASEAYPSEHDLRLAFYSDVSYVIITLKDKNKPAIRSFKIVEGKINEEEVRIE